MARLRYNGIYGKLAAPLSDISTGISLESPLVYNGGVSVPSLSGTDYFPMSLIDEEGQLLEIVHVTGHTTETTNLTVLRGQEGTTAAVRPLGTILAHAPTTADFSVAQLNDVAQIAPMSGQALIWSSGTSKWTPGTVSGGGGGGGESLPIAYEEFSIAGGLGDYVISLAYPPVDILILTWVGIVQPPSEYSWVGDEITLSDTEFVSEPGDKVTVVYTYDME